MLLGILAGCTPPKENETEETYTLPGVNSQTPGETGQTDSEPRPGAETQQPEDPAGNEEGLEIESEYTFEIGDDLGVGGN